MKTLILCILVLTIASVSNAQNVNIPDTAFLNALIEEGVDTNGDSLISYAEAEDMRSLIIDTRGGWGCNEGNENSITSLVGIEAFINLDTLWYSCGQLRNLNISSNKKLKYLNCSANYLDSLDISNNTCLKELYCVENQITNLDVSKNTALEVLNCGYNKITNLDVSNIVEIQKLSCWWNDLTEIDISNNVNLTFLDLDGNKITHLDVSKNIALSELRCEYNELASVDISNNTALKYFYCGGNEITNLDISNNTNLTFIWLYDLPMLVEICVWESFNQDSVELSGLGTSPNVRFTTDCKITVANVYKENSKIDIYPNPSEDIINIEIENPNNATIEIYNVSGSLIFSKELNLKIEKIDVSGLSAGIYIVKLIHDSVINVSKVVVR